MELSTPFEQIAKRWNTAQPRLRLLIGFLIVSVVGLVGLTPKAIFGVPVVWPYIALIAAVGWGRSGLAFGPMVLLVLFGFLQDVSQAPWGSHSLANLLTYGLAVLAIQTFDIERSPAFAFGIPLVCLFAGIVLIWFLASISSGHAVRILPLLSAFFATAILHILIAPLFDLGIRRGDQAGGV